MSPSRRPGAILVLFLGAFGALGCGGGHASTSRLSQASVAPATSTTRATRPAADSTRYEIGDYVTYRYSGGFTPEPVILRERIVAKKGNRLVIEVVARRGREERRWRQVVTDTPGNEKNNVVDELYEFVGGISHKLANTNNEDLYRLYGWTVFTPDGKPRDVRVGPGRVTFAGQSFDCDRTEGANVFRSRPIRFETFECESFVWTHGPARFWEEDSGKEVSRVDVIDFGRGDAPPRGE